MDFSTLESKTIARWVGTEMALSDGCLDNGPVRWEHSSVPYLQLISIDVLLTDGSIYRLTSQADDGSGYYGLLLTSRNTMDAAIEPEVGSIFRTRDLSELPVGLASVAITEVEGPNSVLRVEIAVKRRKITFWAAEVSERDDGRFDVVGCDESILVQVDGARPRW